MRRFLPLLLLFAGLAVSGTAAYYSIFGLSKLFAGAAFQVIIMASSLEVAKLITASVVYRYWTSLATFLKIYLSAAVLILIVITSLGVYGFLSSAYEQTSNSDKISSMEIARIESSVTKYKTLRDDYILEKEQVLKEINQLREGVTTILSSSETSRAIANASQNRKLVQKQLEDAIKSRDIVESKIHTTSDSLFKYEGLVIEAKASADKSAELGPLKYLSRVTGFEMDIIVNWFILLLVVVLDPLAIALLITSSSLLSVARSQVSEKTSPHLEKVVLAPDIKETPPEEESPHEESSELDSFVEEFSRPDIYQDAPNSNPSASQLKAMTSKQREEYNRKLGHNR